MLKYHRFSTVGMLGTIKSYTEERKGQKYGNKLGNILTIPGKDES